MRTHAHIHIRAKGTPVVVVVPHVTYVTVDCQPLFPAQSLVLSVSLSLSLFFSQTEHRCMARLALCTSPDALERAHLPSFMIITTAIIGRLPCALHVSTDKREKKKIRLRLASRLRKSMKNNISLLS